MEATKLTSLSDNEQRRAESLRGVAAETPGERRCRASTSDSFIIMMSELEVSELELDGPGSQNNSIRVIHRKSISASFVAQPRGASSLSGSSLTVPPAVSFNL
jgi:hypothetical protein